jgi:hypothetical protein
MKKKLAKATAGEKKAVMKALLDRTLLVITAFAAVSVAGAGFYYVSSASEPPRPGSRGGCPGPAYEAAKPDCGEKPDCGSEPACTDQKKAEDQNPS